MLLEVHTTYELVCNGVLYAKNDDFESPVTTSCFVNNVRKERLKIKNNSYDINTSSYKKLTLNKKNEVIELYNQFEKYILAKDKKIIVNYLHKGIVFKLNNRMIEVVIKQNELSIIFLDIIKDYDIDNKLYIRKGYENQKLCYAMNVADKETLDYAIKLFDKEYELLIEDSENKKIDELKIELCNKIKEIDSAIKVVEVNKGTMFKGNRNFAILEKRKYGIHVRLLNVEDCNSILGVVGRTTYEPLCRYYDVKQMEDINLILPLLEKSFNMTKYPARDIKAGIVSADNL